MACEPVSQANETMEKSQSPRKTERTRIETQIHRRSKAKAVFPLEAEWQSGSECPSNLRMPSEKMDKHRHVADK